MKITFGKYNNKEIEDLENEDGNYFKWLYFKSLNNELSDKKLQQYILDNYKKNEAYLWVGCSLPEGNYIHTWTEDWDSKGGDQIAYGLIRR